MTLTTSQNSNPEYTERLPVHQRCSFILLFLLASFLSQAQSRQDTVSYSANIRSNTGSGTYAPFLSTANQYDRFDIAPNSLTLWRTLRKEVKTQKTFDYGFGMELDVNISKTRRRFVSNELYAHGKVYFLSVYAGRKRSVYGNQDEELSSGGMLWSQNSRPMPKIAIESNGYVTAPHTNGYVEVKGGLSHGWFDKQKDLTGLLLHHKYAYVRVGGSFPVNLSYGLQHVAQWGGQSDVYGSMPKTLNNYCRIFMGKSGKSSSDGPDLGNHIVSQNMGLDFKLKSALVAFYWQNIAEDHQGERFMTNMPNMEDGLWGMTVKLPKFKPFNHFVFEYLSTTGQDSPSYGLDGVVYGQRDGYYTNSLIPNGWSYRKMTIGNPWLTSPRYNEDGSTSIVNNTVRLYYFSGKGRVKAINYKLTMAYSKNYGNNSSIQTSCDKQFSWQLETSTAAKLWKHVQLSLGVSGDQGSMYGDNLAFLLGVSYSGFWSF